MRAPDRAVGAPLASAPAATRGGKGGGFPHSMAAAVYIMSIIRSGTGGANPLPRRRSRRGGDAVAGWTSPLARRSRRRSAGPLRGWGRAMKPTGGGRVRGARAVPLQAARGAAGTATRSRRGGRIGCGPRSHGKSGGSGEGPGTGPGPRGVSRPPPLLPRAWESGNSWRRIGATMCPAAPGRPSEGGRSPSRSGKAVLPAVVASDGSGLPVARTASRKSQGHPAAARGRRPNLRCRPRKSPTAAARASASKSGHRRAVQ